MKTIQNSVALVTGANRGLGRALVEELLAKGAAKVYATSRKPYDFADARVINIALDLQDPTSIQKLAALAPDASVVINNAGAFLHMNVLGVNMDNVRQEFETNVFGPIQVAEVMAPVLQANGGGILTNIVSVGSWLPFGTYGASKAALWSATNSLRNELMSQGTQVTAVHVGPMDTDMVRGLDLPKEDPTNVARTIIAELAEGKDEILVDDLTRHIKSLLAGPVQQLQYGG